MNNFEDKNNNTPSVSEMEKEIRSLKRKISLAEANMKRAQLIFEGRERSETILSASLKKENQFFKLVLENATNILLLLDVDGRFAYASNTFLIDADIENFGLINGRKYDEVLKPIVSEESLCRLTATVERAIAEKSTVTIEEQLDFNLKGFSRTFSILVTPMTDEDGKIIGIMALFNDITEINDALEAANRANLAKSEFLANMSHEIRTPLNAVLGMANIARGSDDIERIYYCLDKINDSSNHLLGVINDILDMSKIETNHFELFFSEFVFEKMLLRIIDVMRFKIEEKNIAFSLYCDPKIPYMIYSDEQRLAQVIMNLLSNAVKFTPEDGDVSVFAEIESFEGDDYTIRISVKDSGIGISEEQSPRLFKVFSQADSSISRKFGGTGLGLVISKSIVNMLGGEISFDSIEGQGTTFSFNIKTKACRQNPISKINMTDAKILVVDDMPDVLFCFSSYAKKLGIPCTTANSAKAAIEILEKEPHSIIFVDWKMPDEDGLSLAKKINSLEDNQMVVIMISSAEWSDIEKEAKSVGVKEFVSKPILLPVIENILDKYCVDLSNSKNDTLDNFAGKTILLVDDIEINREIIISLLEDTGINIDCAENGREAVEKCIANANKYDLVFMDVQMPEMDGYDATRRIRASNIKELTRLPIVAMTANVFKEDIERCIESGMDDHIGKPVNIEEVLTKIRKWTSVSYRSSFK